VLKKNTYKIYSVVGNKIKKNKILKSNIKIVERGQIDTPYTQIHDR